MLSAALMWAIARAWVGGLEVKQFEHANNRNPLINKTIELYSFRLVFCVCVRACLLNTQP